MKKGFVLSGVFLLAFVAGLLFLVGPGPASAQCTGSGCLVGMCSLYQCTEASEILCILGGGTVDTCCHCGGCITASWYTCSCTAYGCTGPLGQTSCNGGCDTGTGCSGTCGGAPAPTPPPETGGCADGCSWCTDAATCTGSGCTVGTTPSGACGGAGEECCCCGQPEWSDCVGVVYDVSELSDAIIHKPVCPAPNLTICLEAEARDNCINNDYVGFLYDGVHDYAWNCLCGYTENHWSCDGGQYVRRTFPNLSLSTGLPGSQHGYALTFNHGACVCNSSSFDTRPDPPRALRWSCSSSGDRLTFYWQDPVGFADYYSLRLDNLSNGWSGDCDALLRGDFCMDIDDNPAVSTNSAVFYVTPGRTYDFWIHSRTDRQSCWSVPATVSNVSCPAGCDAACDSSDDCGQNDNGDDLFCDPVTDTCRNFYCVTIDDTYDCTCAEEVSWTFTQIAECPGDTYPVSNSHLVYDYYQAEDLQSAYAEAHHLNGGGGELNTIRWYYPVIPVGDFPFSIINGGTADFGYDTRYNLRMMRWDGLGELMPNLPRVSAAYRNYFYLNEGLSNSYGFYSMNAYGKFILPEGDYTLYYNAPAGWCCAPTAPDQPVVASPVGRQPDFDLDFTWWFNGDWGESCQVSADLFNLRIIEDDGFGNIRVSSFDNISYESVSGQPDLYRWLDGGIDWSTILSLNTYYRLEIEADNGLSQAVGASYFWINPVGSWFQSAVGDVYAEGGILNRMPEFGGSCGENYFSEAPGSSGPGFVSTPLTMDLSDFDTETAAVSSQGWWTSSGDQNLTNYYNFNYFYEKFDLPTPNLDSAVLNNDNLESFMTENTAVLYRDSDLEIGKLDLTFDQNLIILVNGEVAITGAITLAESVTGEEIGFLGVFASGDITLDETVGAIEGVYVTDGAFDTCAQDSCDEFDLFSNVVPLDAQGIFIVGSAGFNLDRGVTDSCNPAETFTYRPEYILFAPTDFWSLPQTWQEKAP